MTIASVSRLDGLARERPEWTAYLALLREVERAWDDSTWTSIASTAETAAAPTDGAETTPLAAPLLHGAVFHIDGMLDRWTRRLLRLAARAPEARALAATARSEALDVPGLLEAALIEDVTRLDAIAEAAGVGATAIRAVVSLAVMPLLHAFRSTHADRAPEHWTEGFCPVCGAWPTLAEARGLERARCFRCARCGSDWVTEWLRCPFCGNRDHATLGSLVSEQHRESRKAETCHRCRGYLKTLTTLRPIPARDLLLEDLVTVELDVAALDRDFHRPAERGAVTVARVVGDAGRIERGLLAFFRRP